MLCDYLSYIDKEILRYGIIIIVSEHLYLECNKVLFNKNNTLSIEKQYIPVSNYSSIISFWLPISFSCIIKNNSTMFNKCREQNSLINDRSSMLEYHFEHYI